MLTARPKLEIQPPLRLLVIALHLLLIQIRGFPAVESTSSVHSSLLLCQLLPLFTTEPELQDIINENDFDGNDALDIPKLLCLMVPKMKDTRTGEELVEDFKIFDRDGKLKLQPPNTDTPRPTQAKIVPAKTSLGRSGRLMLTAEIIVYLPLHNMMHMLVNHNIFKLLIDTLSQTIFNFSSFDSIHNIDIFSDQISCSKK